MEPQSESFAESCGIWKNTLIGLARSRTRLNNSCLTSAPMKSQHNGDEKCTKCRDIAASPHQAKVNTKAHGCRYQAITRFDLLTQGPGF
jgi:hypothetical protein